MAFAKLEEGFENSMKDYYKKQVCEKPVVGLTELYDEQEKIWFVKIYLLIKNVSNEEFILSSVINQSRLKLK